MTVSAKDLRFKISLLFDALSKQEQIIITYRNKPKAKLIPYHDDREKDTKSDALFGLWKDKAEDVEAQVRALRKGRSFEQ